MTEEVCCLFCDHDFKWKVREPGACPKCGERFDWACSQGHDNEEFCSPDWENE